VSFVGELLNQTEGLLRIGLHTSEIVEGYKKVGDYLFDEVLPSLAMSEVEDIRDEKALIELVKPCMDALP